MRTREKWFKRNKIGVPEMKGGDDEKKRWRIREFMLMRFIEEDARKTEEYISLTFSALIFGIVWIGGSLVFWACQLSVRCFYLPYPCFPLNSYLYSQTLLHGLILNPCISLIHLS
jgi:hypothetical protein